MERWYLLGAALVAATCQIACEEPTELECEDGYAVVGEVCVDLDECAGEGAGHDCHPVAVCTNSDGSFTCDCAEGFNGDGWTCVDLDECAGEGEGHDCHLNALCTNSDGSYTCDCAEGYSGDGWSCQRIRDAGLVIENATLIDGSGAPPVPGAAVAIVADRVAEVGLSSTLFVYPDDTVIDVEGRVIMPGVINAHAHDTGVADSLETWAQAGVTTLRDVGVPLAPPPEWTDIGDWDDWMAAILAGTPVADLLPPPFVWRDEQLARPEAARALMAGPCLTAAGGYPRNLLSLQINTETVIEGGTEVSPVQDARRKATILAEAGADLFKICLDNHWETQDWGLLTPEQIAAIVEVAHVAGLRVTAHVSADAQLSTCLAADPPIDDAAHIVLDTMSDGNIAAMVDQGITLVPTLAVWESYTSFCTDFGACEGVANLSRYLDAGGLIALGDDYGSPGITLGMPMRDMELMQEAGMTNMEILVAATRNSAQVCGLLDELGTVESGKLADLIVLNADPIADIHALTDVAYVIRDGVIVRAP